MLLLVETFFMPTAKQQIKQELFTYEKILQFALSMPTIHVFFNENQ